MVAAAAAAAVGDAFELGALASPVLPAFSPEWHDTLSTFSSSCSSQSPEPTP